MGVWRLRATGLLVAGVVAISSACSGGSSPVAEDSSASPVPAASADASASATNSEATVSPKQLALTGGELPTGFVISPMTDTQIVQSVRNLVDIAQGSTITPPNCGQTSLGSVMRDLDPAKLGYIVGTKSAAVFSEVLVRRDGNVAALRAQVTGRCATIRTRGTVNNVAIDSTTTFEQIDFSATVLGKDSPNLLTVSADSTTATPTGTTEQSTLYVWAQVGPYFATFVASGVDDEPTAKAVIAAVKVGLQKIKAAT